MTNFGSKLVFPALTSIRNHCCSRIIHVFIAPTFASYDSEKFHDRLICEETFFECHERTLAARRFEFP